MANIASHCFLFFFFHIHCYGFSRRYDRVPSCLMCSSLSPYTLAQIKTSPLPLVFFIAGLRGGLSRAAANSSAKVVLGVHLIRKCFVKGALYSCSFETIAPGTTWYLFLCQCVHRKLILTPRNPSRDELRRQDDEKTCSCDSHMCNIE